MVVRNPGSSRSSELADGLLSIFVTTKTSGNCSRFKQTSTGATPQAFEIGDEVQAGWQRFLEALAVRVVREERERLQTRKGE